MKKKGIVSVMTALTLFASMLTAIPASAAATVVLNPADASPFNGGRFDGWGTALCWWANRIGYSDKLTKAAADAFFSEEGLSLDIARYNLGGGDNPEHNHITRSDSKVPGVWSKFELSADGKDVNITEYDITKDERQLNVAKAALAANPDLYFEGFSNSAPYFMTVSGCTSGGNPADSDNLNPDMYDDFAKFIADSTLLLKNEGIVFESYSPMNEPDTNYWGVNSPKQEGCHFSPGASQSKMIVETRKALDKAGLSNVLVAGMDETDINKSVSNYQKLTDEAKRALGRLDTHTYNGNKRAELKNVAKNANKTLWQSEVDKGGDGGTLANMIIEDVNGMQPAAWVMWDIIDVHKDSEFTDPNGSHSEANASVSYTGGQWGVGMANHDTEELVLTNKYYAYGQFTKYINPGDTIIASAPNTLAAYNKDTGDIKIVANNAGGSSDLQYEFDLSAFKTVGSTLEVIRSDMAGNEKWASITDGTTIEGKKLKTTLKARTITTYVIKTGKQPAAVDGDVVVKMLENTSDGLNYSYAVADNMKDYDVYFAVYDNSGALKGVTKNKPNGSIRGNLKNCGFKVYVWDDMTPKAAIVDEAVSGAVEYAVISGSGIGVGSEIKRGSEIQLELGTNIAGDVTWTVDNPQIASITPSGALSANKPGKATVTAAIGDYSVSKTYDITVYAEIKGKGEVNVGTTTNLVVDTNAIETPVWSVSDETVATIDQNGVLTALKEGSVTVSVVAGEASAAKTIKVTLYKLSGTPSWGNAGTAPADSADYTMAADGDLNTYFDGVGGGYVMYDYGTPFKINSVKLAARSGHTARTVGAKIQGSNDAISWTDLYTVTSAISSGTYTTLEADKLSNNNAYRYFRYTNSPEMTNIAEFQLDASPSSDVLDGEPEVLDIDGFTDDFESSTNIFGASSGDFSEDGKQVYASGRARFSNVLVPVKDTASAELADAIELTDKNKFRLKFNMFAGWESNGKENNFSIKNSEGNEIIGFTLSGGGYNLNQMRIGGADLIADLSEKPVSQCTSSAVRNGSLRGANGWDSADQPYGNNMGLNKTVEIIIDGTGNANITLSGGAADLSYSGVIDMPIDIKSIALSGAYNTSRGRVVSYDNFDADVITYASALPTPAPPATPTPAPVLPENGELINLSFDDGTLESSSAYGKAGGTPKFAEVDGKKCVQFTNSASDVITLTDANGNALLTGMEEFTVSFKVKPTATSAASWWFYASPMSGAQTYTKEKYLGCMTKDATMTFERYNNNGSRPASASAAYAANEWNDVVAIYKNGTTTVYVNGVKAEQSSEVNISELLGKSSVAYIGRANWNAGEYAAGYLDDFVITKGTARIPTVALGDISAVTADIPLPAKASDGSAVTWTSDNTAVIANDGKVTRPDETTTVTLTATMTNGEKTYTQEFKAKVIGYFAVADTFVAYVQNGKIKYESEYDFTGSDYYADILLTVPLPDGIGDQVLEVKKTLNDTFSYNPEIRTYTVEMNILAPRTGAPVVKKIAARTVQVKAEQEMGAYLFAHFVGGETDATEEQIYFSVSKDAKSWTKLNNGNPVLTSNVGEKGVRDPYILRGEDGKFFIIATDLSIYSLGITQGSNKWGYSQTNGSKNIVVWESSDLINWSGARLAKVAPDTAGCTWAPEAIYDPKEGKYMVFWASKTSADNYAKQRMYRSYTEDFKTFTAPEVYIDAEGDIDTTIVNHKGMYYRFTKNEGKSTVTMMRCPLLNGEWEKVRTYTLDNMTGYEGPAVFKLNNQDKWYLLLDHFSGNKGYELFSANDIKIGDFVAESGFTTNLSKKLRHGTVMPITTAEYNALVAAYKND